MNYNNLISHCLDVFKVIKNVNFDSAGES